MKKILLTCGKLSVGGIQKALLSFANELAMNGYEVVILLDDLSGELIQRLSAHIRVEILDSRALAIHKMSLSQKRQLFYYALKKPLFGVELLRLFLQKKHSISGREIAQLLWKYLSKNINMFQEEFDYAISFAGLMGIWNEYLIDRVRAKKKICWIHGNYETTGTKSFREIYYLNQFDNIVTVTETNTKIVQKYVANPSCVLTIHNTMDVDFILKRAKEDIHVKKDCFTIVTMSRLNYGKGIEQGMEAMAILKNRGISFVWYILGDGQLKSRYIEKARRLGVDERVYFLGNMSNPYPYLALADVYFHPSLGEGRSIAIDEAKILCKPVIATNYTTVYDQILDGSEGMILQPFPESLADGLEKLASSASMLCSMRKNLIALREQYYDFNIYKSFKTLIEKE